LFAPDLAGGAAGDDAVFDVGWKQRYFDVGLHVTQNRPGILRSQPIERRRAGGCCCCEFIEPLLCVGSMTGVKATSS
jgi:hypothetical protein